MGNIVGVDLNIDEDYIKGSVEKIVKSAIVQALGDPTTILENAVDTSLSKYVNQDGKECRSGDYRAKPYLNWLAEKVIEETVREVMRETIEENKEFFKAEIKKQLLSKTFAKNMAEQYLQAILDCTSHNWSMPIKISFEKPKED